jgi:hypothetical protein
MKLRTRLLVFCILLLSWKSASTKMKFLILQDFQSFIEGDPGASPATESAEIRQSAISNVYSYAQYHNYDYRLIHVNRTYFTHTLGLHESWIKLFILYSAFCMRQTMKLSYFDYVVYVDSTNYIIQSPTIPLDIQLQLWNQFGDIYLFQHEETAGNREHPHISVTKKSIKSESQGVPLPFDTNNTRSYDGSQLYSGFQIWKNTKKNKGLLKKWMLVTKLVENAAPLKTTFPYETDSLTKDVVPIFDKVVHYFCFTVLPAFSRLSLEQQQLHRRRQQQQQRNDHQPSILAKAQLSFVSYLSLPFSSLATSSYINWH